MYVAELRFFQDSDGNAAEAAQKAVVRWLHALRNSGQVLGREFPLARTGPAEMLARVLLPLPDSLDPRHDLKYVTQAREQMRAAGLRAPSLMLLGEDVDSTEPCACSPERRSRLVLFTTFISMESPLRCGDCFGPIPLYTITPTYNDEEHYGILAWEGDYQACDRLQMGCQTGERFGLREMSRLDSSLTRRGRDLCRTIEQKTGVPTFYVLHRYAGRSIISERRRSCPGCGGAWLLSEPWHDLFDFRCEPCRLVSNIAITCRSRNLSEENSPLPQATGAAITNLETITDLLSLSERTHARAYQA